jgi:hypothetical protein
VIAHTSTWKPSQTRQTSASATHRAKAEVRRDVGTCVQQGRHDCTSSKGQAQGADTSGEMGSMRVSNSPCSLTLLQMYHHKREERKAGRDVKHR